jgi:hypothetical protein
MIYMTMQALDEHKIWRDIEYIPSSWSGNSYHQVFLGKNEYWEFEAPLYDGAMKTKLRLKLLYKRNVKHCFKLSGSLSRFASDY